MQFLVMAKKKFHQFFSNEVNQMEQCHIWEFEGLDNVAQELVNGS